jgi:hypothetical protein
MTRIPLTFFLLFAGACHSASSTPPASERQQSPASRRVAPPATLAGSVWGSAEETIVVTREGTSFEGQCRLGEIPETITLDAEGRFDLPGTLRQAGGARLDADTNLRVRYVGRVAGDELLLTILEENGATILRANMRKGRRGDARPCP